jgi:quinolinate synthase
MSTDTITIEDRIAQLKQERNAIILAHNYQESEIQDVADFLGDSLELARKSAEIDCQTIVFCGVHFMAETAKLLNPNKTVLLPDLDAGCSLAEGCTAEMLKSYQDFLRDKKGQDIYTIAYVNCSAAVKALTDTCCTSGNAVKVVEQAPKDKHILFVPDFHLGTWLKKKTGRDMTLWNGSCSVHESLSRRDLMFLKQEHPDAITIAHPECVSGVLDLADEVLSTAGMVAISKSHQNQTFIVGTEANMIHRLRREGPSNTYIPAPGLPKAGEASCSNCVRCPHMALNTLEKLEACLRDGSPEVVVDPAIVPKARASIENMLKIRR